MEVWPPLRLEGRSTDENEVQTETQRERASSVLRERLLVVAALSLFALVLLRNAWVAEDAYVTFRTLDNLLEGHGLRWNVEERVQAFSNPLWLFFVAPLVVAFSDPYPAALCVSVLLSLGVALLTVKKIAADRASALLALGLFVSSRAFVDYSTSGLENPLSHMLLALFFLTFWSSSRSQTRLLSLTALTALVCVNRLDLVLIVAPSLTVAFFETRGTRRLLTSLLGVLPFAAWECFSLIYYGFLFPNTAYAKLNTGLPKEEVLAQGALYFVDLLSHDPVTVLAFLAAFWLSFATRRNRTLAPLLGLGTYLTYVLFIGGDFMSGRFFSSPYLVASLLIARVPLQSFGFGVGAFALALSVCLLGPTPPIKSGAEAQVVPYGPSGIADERRYYYAGAGLLQVRRSTPFPDNWLISEGRRDRKLAESRDQKLIVQRINVGFHGFKAGPKVHVIDPLALGDPLLARLPAAFEPHWRVGHYDRVVPEGYRESIRGREARLRDPKLNEYYEQLLLITRGRLFDQERWQAIAGFLVGRYDSLIDRQRYRFSDPLVDRTPLAWRDAWTEDQVVPEDQSTDSQEPLRRFSGQSFLIQSKKPLRLSQVSFHYSSPKPARLYFLRGTTIVFKVDLPATPEAKSRRERIEVPSGALGFDALYFRGERGPFAHAFYGLGPGTE